MSVIGLLVAVGVTCLLVWLAQKGTIPAPFTWIVYAVLLVVWIIVLLQLTGIGSHINLGRI